MDCLLAEQGSIIDHIRFGIVPNREGVKAMHRGYPLFKQITSAISLAQRIAASIRRKREGMLLHSPDFDCYVIPQTGAQLCRLPHYRLLRPLTDDDFKTVEGLKAEATAYRDLY